MSSREGRYGGLGYDGDRGLGKVAWVIMVMSLNRVVVKGGGSTGL